MEHTTLWHNFAHNNNLSEKQLKQFQQYYSMLIEYNELFNITAITQLKAVLAYHFEDSLKLGDYRDLSTIKSICDIGTGGGFPGIPLKIKYPHLNVLLLEVSQKKVAFLQEVIQNLGLSALETCDLDWRTFLRKTAYDLELFCARASLHPDELVRVFAPSCSYKNAQLVYWASQEWRPTEKEKIFLKGMQEYQVGSRKRCYAFFAKN